ncbi:unnamed protein product, partial [marine sediment metagenome]
VPLERDTAADSKEEVNVPLLQVNYDQYID